ncbi:MAG: hypothetical protein HC869_08615 [Rhodospirillales bacterium]|nr:hypothetical protein [Rhodospirillales bacterium]
MRLFWMAWGFAVLLILASVGGTAWVFAVSDGWSDALRIGARGGALVASLAAFVGAFRLALLATASLRFVLAQNLAALIVMELDDLRQAVQERAESLAGQAAEEMPTVPGMTWQSSEALRIPRFFGDREEIRRLLGPATEQTLEQVLLSLQSYNQIVDKMKSQDADRSAALDLWKEIAVVQERLKLAAREVAPFCIAN